MQKLTTPTMTSGAQPPEGQTRATRRDGARMNLSDLASDPAFTPRAGLSKEHIQQLSRALRNCTDLDPITVWDDPVSGKTIILDGRYRAAAYHLTKIESIPVRHFRGDRKAALLEAARENAKTTYPWTTAECTQYAWGLVIAEAGSKREIAQAANVRTSTVGNMRKCLADMTRRGATPTGNWWLDRQDKPLTEAIAEDDAAARKLHIDRLRAYLKGTEVRFKTEFGKKPTMEELGVALRWHLGQPRFKAMLSGGFTADEEDDDEFSYPVGEQPWVPPSVDCHDDF